MSYSQLSVVVDPSPLTPTQFAKKEKEKKKPAIIKNIVRTYLSHLPLPQSDAEILGLFASVAQNFLNAGGGKGAWGRRVSPRPRP